MNSSSDSVPDSRSNLSSDKPVGSLQHVVASSTSTAVINHVIEYGQDHIVIDINDYTKGLLLDITSEVEVGNVDTGNLSSSSDLSPTQKHERRISQTDVANSSSTGTRSRASSEDTLYCFCRQPWDQNNVRFMIECTHCKGWFHGSCVGIPERLGSTIESYHCKVCEPIAGPIIYKDPNEKPIKAGTTEFLKRLKEKEYLSADKVMLRLKGDDVTFNELYKNGFSKPILVHDKAGLEMRVPKSNFTVREVEAYVGSDTEVDVIDVERQTDIKMSMKEFCDYFTYPARNKLYNLISLEFSKTRLNNMVMAPAIVRKLDWVKYWKLYTDMEPPSVSKYCLISTKESFTDFHIDFGGTSVWYHVLWGQKVFYLVEPTPTNLRLYEQWMSSNAHDYETFFADTVDYCYQIVLRAGETLFIPTGWIHAVLTTKDSLVFGGNFLHHLNVDIQLKVYEIEKALNVPNKYLFPFFETCTWYAASELITGFEDQNSSSLYPRHWVEGLRALAKAFRSWTGEDTVAREIPPNAVKPLKLIKQITKLVRTCDRRLRGPITQTKTANKKTNAIRKSSLTGSLQSISNPTSPDMPSDSSSTSEIKIRSNSFSAVRKNRISDSSASPTTTYTSEISEELLAPDGPDDTPKPIKIKIRKISVSDTSNQTSPGTLDPSLPSLVSSPYLYNADLPSPCDEPAVLSPANEVLKDQFTFGVLATENQSNISVYGSQDYNSVPAPASLSDSWQGQENNNEEAECENQTTGTGGYSTGSCKSSSTLRIIEPSYYDENGLGHYITNDVLVEPLSDEQDTNDPHSTDAGNSAPFPRFRQIEPEEVDDTGCRHYVSPQKLAILETRCIEESNSSVTETPGSSLFAELTHVEAPMTDESSKIGETEVSPTEGTVADESSTIAETEVSPPGGTVAESLESSIQSSQSSPPNGELVIALSSDSESKHKHRRHHRKHKHHHHSKKSKRSKSRDSAEIKKQENRTVLQKKAAKAFKLLEKSYKNQEKKKRLDSALAGTLDGMESLLKDANYTERLAESAKSTTSSSMKDAFAEIIENESVPLEKRLKRSKPKKAADPWAEENIQKVHQDDNYIYLPLAGESSDEEGSPKKRKVMTKEKRKEKEVWSPSVKVGQITKREACPTRTKAKVLAVEKGLENAAAVLAKEERPKSTAVEKAKKKSGELKLKVVKPHSVSDSDNAWRLASESATASNPRPSTSRSPGATAGVNKSPKKGKKGLMTPKQRLGKILKIGKKAY